MSNSDQEKERCFSALEAMDGAAPILEYIRLLQNTLAAHRATIAAQDRMLAHFGRQVEVREQFDAQGG